MLIVGNHCSGFWHGVHCALLVRRVRAVDHVCSAAGMCRCHGSAAGEHTDGCARRRAIPEDDVAERRRGVGLHPGQEVLVHGHRERRTRVAETL